MRSTKRSWGDDDDLDDELCDAGVMNEVAPRLQYWRVSRPPSQRYMRVKRHGQSEHEVARVIYRIAQFTLL